jgi:AbiU2
MTDPELLARANDISDRLSCILDVEVANGRVLRALLQDLHARDLSVVKEPHITAIKMVRAGLLRATISSVMACLDSRGPDRAGVGQLLHMLEDAQVVAVYATGTATLQRAKDKYEALVKSELFERGRSLRDGAVAHLLTGQIPEATYETLYELHDKAERLTIGLYEVCGLGKPRFLGHQIGGAGSPGLAPAWWPIGWCCSPA